MARLYSMPLKLCLYNDTKYNVNREGITTLVTDGEMMGELTLLSFLTHNETCDQKVMTF